MSLKLSILLLVQPPWARTRRGRLAAHASLISLFVIFIPHPALIAGVKSPLSRCASAPHRSALQREPQCVQAAGHACEPALRMPSCVCLRASLHGLHAMWRVCCCRRCCAVVVPHCMHASHACVLECNVNSRVQRVSAQPPHCGRVRVPLSSAPGSCSGNHRCLFWHWASLGASSDNTASPPTRAAICAPPPHNTIKRRGY